MNNNPLFTPLLTKDAPLASRTLLEQAHRRVQHRLGIRPSVRGVAMNPVDHPHGGGEGKTSGGRHPVTPWGKKTRGPKTRKKQPSDRLIIRRRHAKK